MADQAVAFDFDGTIVDISHRDYAVYKDLISYFEGIAMPFGAYWQKRRAKTDIYLILTQSGVSDKKRMDTFLKHRADLIEDERYLALDSIISGAIESINDGSRYFKPYLVSTRINADKLLRQLSIFGIKNLFSDIIISGKDKRNYYSKIKNLKLIVGDTENDIYAANALGIPSIAVLSGIRNEQTIKQYNPTAVSETVADIDFGAMLRHNTPQIVSGNY